MNEEKIAIEVAFAAPEKQEVIALEVPAETLINEVVHLSGIESRFPDYSLWALTVGVWGEVKPETYVVQAGDRVEVYRSLVTNAKDARRRRAEAQASKEAQVNKKR